MSQTWTDTAGNIHDQIGIVVADGPIHNGRDALGIVPADTAFFDAGGETYEGNDGKIYDALPVFYPGTDTYEDAAGNIHAVTMIGSAPDGPDFTGWSAGSEAGVYTDGVTGGKFPTGCAVSLSFDGGEDATLEITEATHTEDGVEAIAFSLTAIGAGCLFELYFPNGQEGQPASEGQTWRLDACLRVDAGDVTPINVAVSLGSDGGEIDLNEDAVQDGGNLASSLRTIQGAALAETTEVHGYISFVIPAGSVTITIALKLEQIS